MKYRSKVVEIEAMRFTDEDKDSVYLWCRGMAYPDFGDDAEKKPVLKIYTLEGKMTANIGDWIIKGTEGEFYPCKDSVFQRKYERVKTCKHGVLALDRCWDCDPNIGQTDTWGESMGT